jgi:hypothetical protein
LFKAGSLFERVALWLSHKRRFDGLWIGIVAEKQEYHLLERVEAALKLIEHHDPLRYSRILRDIRRIWVSIRYSGGGEFSPVSGICHLDKRFVENSSTRAIASLIVHESTHGYPCLRKMGYPEELRYRIERICIRQELLFAQWLPDSRSLCENLERKLARDPSFWSNREFANRRPGQVLAAAKAAGLPDWSVKLSFRLHELRQRLFRQKR